MEEEISAKDLEVSEPKILPGDSFYFLKNWLREIRLFFSFNYVERVELRTKIANEKLIELKKMITDKKKPEEVKKTIENYQKEIERIKKEAEKIKEKGNENPKLAAFLDKFLHQQLLHQKLLQKLENQVSPEVVEKIRKVREKNLEKFQEVILKLENRKEKISNLEIFLKKLKGVPCGGWHMLGSVVCECRGKLEKFICPSGAVCDEGIDTCYGECGNCKCYNSSNQEVSCNGLEKFFKESVSHSMPTNPSEPVEKIYCISLWNPVCGKDGKTYSNECYAKLAGVEIAYKGECNKEDRIEGIIKECRWTMKDQCERMIGKCYSIEIPENGEKILCTDKEKRKILEKFLNKNVVLKEIENPKSSLKMCPCYLEYQKIEEKK